MATIKDIAARAQVSVCTVSRFINGKIKVKPETAARIETAIEELGYIPNTIAKSLKTKTSQNIALILPTINNSYFSELTAGVDAVLQKQNYSLFIFQHYNKAEIEHKIARKLIENQIAGAIFVGLPHDYRGDAVLQQLKKDGVEIVLTNRVFIPREYPLVFSDFYSGGRQAADHLLALGHRKIGVITGFFNHPESDIRLQGFLDRLAEEGVAVKPEHISAGHYSHETGAQAVIPLLEERVEAIFSISDLMAVGVLKHLQQAGIKVPQDLALVGFGNTLFARLTTPELTSIDLQNQQVGVKSAEVLLDLIHGKKVEPVNSLSTRLIKREST